MRIPEYDLVNKFQPMICGCSCNVKQRGADVLGIEHSKVIGRHPFQPSNHTRRCETCETAYTIYGNAAILIPHICEEIFQVIMASGLNLDATNARRLFFYKFCVSEKRWRSIYRFTDHIEVVVHVNMRDYFYRASGRYNQFDV